jgi:hypothetical protein
MLVFTLACGSTATVTPKPAATQAQEQATAELPTEVPAEPTKAEPTATPTQLPPTPTSAPVFEGQEYSGTGDDIIDLSGLPETPLLLTLSHQGNGNFIIQAYDADNNLKDLIVNTIGDYQGRRALNLFGETPARLSVKADGPWSIKIDDISKAPTLEVPGKIEGNGDDVILLTGGKPDTISLSHQGQGNFIVVAHEADGLFPNLVVNEIGKYEGKNLISTKTDIIEIQADGPWSMEVTGR